MLFPDVYLLRHLETTDRADSRRIINIPPALALTEEQIKANSNIPTAEIEEDIRITQKEIDGYETELKSLRNNPIENRLDIYMREGKILKRKDFNYNLKQILEYRNHATPAC